MITIDLEHREVIRRSVEFYRSVLAEKLGEASLERLLPVT